MGTYLLAKDAQNFSAIPDDMRQVFHHEFTKTVYKNEIIRMKTEGAITEEDLEVAKMLFKYRFATLQQLAEGCNTEKKLSAFYSRLETLMTNRIINKFGLEFTPDIDSRVHEDGLQVYCLDIGGQYLLTHFWQDDTLLDWYYIINVGTSELVSRALMITEIGLAFQKTNPAGLRYFKPNPELRIGNKTLVPAFEVCFEKGPETTYFLGEIARSQDIRTSFRDRMHKWNLLLKTNGWKKYYNTMSQKEPVLLVLTGDDESALMAGQVLTDAGEIDLFRLCTEDRIKKPLYEKGTFLRYNREDTKLGLTAIANFKPAKVIK